MFGQPIFNNKVYLDENNKIIMNKNIEIGDFYEGGYVFRLFNDNIEPSCETSIFDGEFGANPFEIYPPNDPSIHTYYASGVCHGLVANTLNYTGIAPFEPAYNIADNCKGKICSDILIADPIPPIMSYPNPIPLTHNSCVRKCTDLVSNGYSDWFLPSYVEMNCLYNACKLHGFGNFEDGAYWCSNGATPTYGYIINFNDPDHNSIRPGERSILYHYNLGILQEAKYVAIRQF